MSNESKVLLADILMDRGYEEIESMAIVSTLDEDETIEKYEEELEEIKDCLFKYCNAMFELHGENYEDRYTQLWNELFDLI